MNEYGCGACVRSEKFPSDTAVSVGHTESTDEMIGPELACFGVISNTRKRLLARFVNQMAASVYGTSSEILLLETRGTAKISRARQIAIYLMHTVLSLPYHEIGIIYGRDRTTISYACRVIEDLRDTPAFDDRIIEMERTVKIVLSLTNVPPVR